MSQQQYTIRNVSPALDAKLRAKALREKKSLNKLVLEELEAAVIPKDNPVQALRDEFNDLVGSWQDDPGFDEAMTDMRQVDARDWQ
jgi:plasmid stability protein